MFTMRIPQNRPPSNVKLKYTIMKKVILALSACIILVSCNQSQKKEDTAMAAIDRFMTEMGANYAPGEYCIPWNLIAGMEEDNPEDIKVWGDFWVENYDMAGDTLKSVSGGSHPGCMHVKKADDKYEVTQFDAVADGSDFEPTAREIFGDRYDALIALMSDDDAKSAARAQSIRDYSAANKLDISYVQDYGWLAVKIK